MPLTLRCGAFALSLISPFITGQVTAPVWAPAGFGGGQAARAGSVPAAMTQAAPARKRPATFIRVSFLSDQRCGQRALVGPAARRICIDRPGQGRPVPRAAAAARTLAAESQERSLRP